MLIVVPKYGVNNIENSFCLVRIRRTRKKLLAISQELIELVFGLKDAEAPFSIFWRNCPLWQRHSELDEGAQVLPWTCGSKNLDKTAHL